jgi:diguanylate cyclase (GGDEF)-like protein
LEGFTLAKKTTKKTVTKKKTAATIPIPGDDAPDATAEHPDVAADPPAGPGDRLDAALLEGEARRVDLESANARLRAEMQKLRVEVAELRAQMDLVASADPVSGALNRRSFLDVFRREWQRSRRYGRCMSVIMADVDQFKAVNDGYGTDMGDRILRMVAQTFRKTARTSDVIGRYGGDSFAIVLPEAELQAARRVAERLRKALENSVFDHKTRPILVTASFGVACSEEADPEPEALLLRADDCLYQAKRAGRNVVVDEES